MSEPLLQARSPLDGVAVPGRHGRAGGPAGVTVALRRSVALAVVTVRKGEEAAFAAALRAHAGLEAPAGPRRAVAGGFALVGTGPRQWLAFGEDEAGAKLVAGLPAALGGTAACVDVSDGRVVLTVAGPQSRAALAKGVPIDLDPRAFRPGDAAATAAAHVGLLIWIDEAPTFGLAVPSSYAGSFWGWLMASAAEFGCDVVA